MCYFWPQLFLGSTSSLCGSLSHFCSTLENKASIFNKNGLQQPIKQRAISNSLHYIFWGRRKLHLSLILKLQKIFQSLFTKVVYNSVYKQEDIPYFLYILWGCRKSYLFLILKLQKNNCSEGYGHNDRAQSLYL